MMIWTICQDSAEHDADMETVRGISSSVPKSRHFEMALHVFSEFSVKCGSAHVAFIEGFGQAYPLHLPVIYDL